MKLILHFIVFTLIATMSFGCKNKKRDDEIVIPVNILYNNGLDLLNNHQYKKAADEFGEVFLQHPSDPLTAKAELMQAYALYLGREYEEACDVLDIFTKLHPQHNDIAYGFYLKALSHYMQISEVALDQSRTFIAKEALQEVINYFPSSEYANDCRSKINLVDNHLAGKEMEEGRFYLKRKNPMAAILHFENIITNYKRTTHVPESLYRLIESYLSLGLNDEANKYYEVLQYNYSDDKWFKYGKSLLKI